MATSHSDLSLLMSVFSQGILAYISAFASVLNRLSP